MAKNLNRRDFLKKASVVAMGGVGGGIVFSKEALAQSSTESLNKARGITTMASQKGTVVMPDGSLRTRAELMRQLGLNPSTPPDAWLAICGGGCGSNASALDMQTRQKLMQRGFRFEGSELISKP